MFSSINVFNSLVTNIIPTYRAKVYNINTVLIYNPTPAAAGITNSEQYPLPYSTMTSDEQYIIIYYYGSHYPSISTDGGNTWQLFSPLYWNLPNDDAFLQNIGNNKQLQVIRSISDDKQTLFVSNQYRSYIIVSRDGASTWTRTNLSGSLASAAMNASGQYMYYVLSGNLYRSSNYGVSFSQLSGASINLGNGFPANTNMTFFPVDVSPSGSTVGVVDKTTGGFWISRDSGSTFQNNYTSTSKFYLANSNYCLNIPNDTGYVHYSASYPNHVYSNDYGITFTTTPLLVSTVKASLDGQSYIYTNLSGRVSGIMYTSNSGVTNTNYIFSKTAYAAATITNPTNTSYIAMCFSNFSGSNPYWPLMKITNNTTVSFLGNSQLYRNGIPPFAINPNNLSMSNDGAYILFGDNGLTNYLIMSSNSGLTWTNLNLNNPTGGWPVATSAGLSPSLSYAWSATAMSGNGQIMIAASDSTGSNGYVFISINYGQYFTKISGSGNTRGLPTVSNITWSHASMTLDGTIILLTVNGSTPYLSKNSGASFSSLGTTVGLPSSGSWNFCTLSATSGAYMLLSAASGLYLTSNTGTNWSLIDGTTNTRGLPTSTNQYSSLSISNDGSIMIALYNGGGFFYSNNYGVNWSQLDTTTNTIGLPTAATNYFTAGGVSGNGQKILVGLTNSFGYLSTNGGTSFSTVNSSTTPNGLPQQNNIGWSQISFTSNGNMIYAGCTNAGYGSMSFNYDGSGNYWSQANWSFNNVGPIAAGSLQYNRYLTYSAVKFSGDGTTVLAATTVSNYYSSALSISYDGGYSFSVIGQKGQLIYNVSLTWLLGYISYDGKYMVLGTSNGIYLSRDYGLTFLCIAGTLTGAAIISGLPTTAQTWSSCALSSSGAVSILGINGGALYLSTNNFGSYSIISGPSSQYTSNGLPLTNQNWYQTECTNNASIILASINSGALYLTTDTGSSWVAIGGASNSRGLPTVATPWRCISVSKTDGQYMLSCANAGGLYISKNTGTSWTRLDGPSNTNGFPTVSSSTWISCVMSDSGGIMAAAVANGYLYYSTNSGTTWQTYNYPYKISTQLIPWNSLSMTANGSKIFVTLTGYDYFIITIT